MKQANRTEQTKESFRRALLTLMQEKPANKITVKELTGMTGYDRTTFYRYYQDIYDLLDDIQESILKDIQELMDRYTEDMVRESPYGFIRGMFEYSQQHKEAILTLFPNRVYLDLNRPILEILRNTVLRNVSYVYPNADPKDYLPYFYNVSGGYVSILSYWLDQGTESIDEITKITTDMVMGVNRAVFES